MTRFLPRVWKDPDCGSTNEETIRLFRYHNATKHSYRSVRENARSLDWHNQPDPFRTYEDTALIALPPEPGFPETGTFAAMAALEGKKEIVEEGKSGPAKLDVTLLSRLLWHAMAVSAWKKVSNTAGRYSLRVNPSSGNLHPTETYLALRGFAGIDSGLYHYRADRHALELRSRGAWTSEFSGDLEIPWASGSQLMIGLTSIFWREAWKYGDRAYRYCCHDLGHAMMSLLLAARALGLRGGTVAHFSDLRLAKILGLADSDEAPMAFLIFLPEKNPNDPAGDIERPLAGIPNPLSEEEISCELILGIHRSTILPDPAGPLPRAFPPDPGVPLFREALRNPSRDASLASIVRRRRSALDFDARTPPMELDDVEQLLDFATRDWSADWRGNLGGELARMEKGADFISLYLYVHRVRDCEPGVYRWDRLNRNLEQLYRGNADRVASFLSLEQPLAGNACFAISMIADLQMASRVFGNRGYRYVHFEAGAIGQRIYVGAEALGWNSTGIGAFYDDDVHRYLGFMEEGENPVSESLRKAEQSSLVMPGSPASHHTANKKNADRNAASPLALKHAANHPPEDPSALPQQVIYHFAVGRAVPDPRIEA